MPHFLTRRETFMELSDALQMNHSLVEPLNIVIYT
jgi:hypothetical protein